MRTITPAKVEAEVLQAPISHCELLPQGLAGTVLINAETYSVEILGYLPAVGEPVVLGYRFCKEGSEESYDVHMSHGVMECECKDFEYRRRNRDTRGCKHCIVARELLGAPVEGFQPVGVVTADDDFEFDAP